MYLLTYIIEYLKAILAIKKIVRCFDFVLYNNNYQWIMRKNKIYYFNQLYIMMYIVNYLKK